MTDKVNKDYAARASPAINKVRAEVHESRDLREKCATRLLKSNVTRYIATFNARTLRLDHRRHELTEMAYQYNYDIVALQEHRIVHKPGGAEIQYEKQPHNYTLVTSSADRNAQQAAVRGVGLLLSKHARDALASVEKVSPRIIRADFTGNPTTTTIAAYSPTLPCGNASDKKEQEEAVQQFYQCLEDAIRRVPPHNLLIVLGDMNARLGTDIVKYSYHQETNYNGQRLFDLAEATDLVIGNTSFRKRHGKLMTHLNSANGTKSQLDYIMIRRKWRGCLQNVEAYSSFSSVGSDHRVVAASVKLRLRANMKQSRKVRFYWTALSQETDLQARYSVEIRNRYEGLKSESGEDISSQYDCLVKANLETAANILPKKKRDRKLLASEDSRVSAARTELQKASEEHNSLCNQQTSDSLQSAKAKLDRAYLEANQDYLQKKMDDIKKERKGNNTSSPWKTINDITGRKGAKEGQVKGRSQQERLNNWYQAFKNLLGNPPVVSDEDEELEEVFDELPIRTDSFDEVELQKAIDQLKNGKSCGADQIPGEVIKYCNINDIILHFCNAVFNTGQRPELWDITNITPIPKSGDLSNPENYRGISLTSIISKTFNRMLLNRIRDHVDPLLRFNQNGFRQGRGTVGQILALRRLLEGVQARKLPAVLTFVDFRKAFDSIHRGKMCKILLSYGIPEKIVSAISNMYDTTKARVISPDGETEEFDIQAGVLQGDTLAPFLFIIVLDYCLRQAIPEDKAQELGFTITPRQSRRIGKETITDLGFADDLALLSDTVDQAQELLLALERHAAKIGLQINSKKTEYMSFNQSSNVPISTLNGSKLQKVHNFKYLGAWMASTSQDIHVRKGLAWKSINKLQKIWKSDLPRQLKVNIFQTLVEPVLLYGSETWTLTKQLERSLDGCYTRLLRAALNISWMDKVPNTELYGDIPKVTSKISDRRLRTAGHYHRHPEEAANKFLLWVPKHGSSGARNKTYVQLLLEDTGVENTSELACLMEDRNDWKSRCADV